MKNCNLHHVYRDLYLLFSHRGSRGNVHINPVHAITHMLSAGWKSHQPMPTSVSPPLLTFTWRLIKAGWRKLRTKFLERGVHGPGLCCCVGVRPAPGAGPGCGKTAEFAAEPSGSCGRGVRGCKAAGGHRGASFHLEKELSRELLPEKAAC